MSIPLDVERELSFEEAVEAKEEGFWVDAPEAMYHATNACSQTRLKALERSPAHAKLLIDDAGKDEGEKRASSSNRIGRSAHAGILQPERFEDEYVQSGRCEAITGSNKRCKNNGSVLRKDQGGERHWFCGIHDGPERGKRMDVEAVLSEKDYRRTLGVIEAVRNHKEAESLLQMSEREKEGGEDAVSGMAEVSLLFNQEWLDESTGEQGTLLCRSRLDYYDPELEGGGIIDVKTTDDASKDPFKKLIWWNRYYRQLAFYRRGLRALGLPASGPMVIVAVETKPPYGVAVYEVEETAIRGGDRQLDDLIALYGHCFESNVWPGYSQSRQMIGLPHWAYEKL